MATHSLRDVKIRRLALTRRGANKSRKPLFKSDDMGNMFSNLSDEEKKIMKNKKPGNLAKADFLLEVLDYAEELRKGDLKTEDAADFLEDLVIKHEKDIPVEKDKKDDEGNPDETLSLDETREIFGVKKDDSEISKSELDEILSLKN